MDVLNKYPAAVASTCEPDGNTRAKDIRFGRLKSERRNLDAATSGDVDARTKTLGPGTGAADKGACQNHETIPPVARPRPTARSGVTIISAWQQIDQPKINDGIADR